MLRALLILARLRLLLFVLAIPLVGFGWAHWDHSLDLRGKEQLGWVVLAWPLLHIGTMWLNAHLDCDQGDILLGRPVPVPHATVWCGYAALLTAITCAFIGNVVAGSACLACAILSILYSHPWTVWKGHPLLGPFVNFLGYGLLSPLAGWAVVEVPLDLRTIFVWLLGSVGALGCYFAAQAFQETEDRVRGYRTLVATHGARGALLAARLCLGIAFTGGSVLALCGWFPRICLVVIPLGVWIDRWLSLWSLQPLGGNERWARGFAYRFLVVIFVGIGLAYVDYRWARWNGQPAAGLGTSAGQPVETQSGAMAR